MTFGRRPYPDIFLKRERKQDYDILEILVNAEYKIINYW